MTDFRDVLAVTVGVSGVRARRTGGRGLADSFVEVPEVGVDGGALGDLVATVFGLAEPTGRPPEATVWSVPHAWPVEWAAALLEDLLGRAGRSAVVASDVATHTGAQGGLRPGVCVDLGPGVVGLATDYAQVWRRLDGWGVPVGGRGGGAWLGQHGLTLALRAADDVPGGSPGLLEAARSAYGPEGGWPGMIRRAAANGELTELFTRFAPAVCAAARDDAHARALLAAAGEEIADLVEAGLALLPEAPVVATGGLLYLEEVRVTLARALGQRRRFLVPGLGGELEGARLIGEHLLAAGTLPHRPPYVLLDRRGVLPAE